MVYRGRAVLQALRVKKHKSSSITLKEYQALLKRVARLMPKGVKVILLGDRGFVDTKLMKYARQELRWHYRIRIKSDFWVWRQGLGWCQVRDFHLGRGQALLLQNVRITKIDPYGPVYLALACALGSVENYGTSSVMNRLRFKRSLEYGLRFDIEESFLDDKF